MCFLQVFNQQKLRGSRFKIKVQIVHNLSLNQRRLNSLLLFWYNRVIQTIKLFAELINKCRYFLKANIVEFLTYQNFRNSDLHEASLVMYERLLPDH